MISVDPEVTQTTVDNQTVSGGGEINHYTFFYCGTLVFLFSHGDFVIVHRPAANCLKLIWDMKTLL
jgi:hypothetical protein